ncbi:RcnB family protein [Parasphingorhabdus sp.]|uniref:RcnB family protein n=1 Tax=Parasphingorhabdus sp. TaxID=2709688 RepID=UPI003D2E0643
MMKKILMILAASTMVATPMIATPAQAASHKTVKKSVNQTQGQREVQKVQKTVTRNNGKRVVTKTTTTQTTHGNRYNGQRYAAVTHKTWGKGQRFDRRYATNFRVINNPRDYRLAHAPRGYQWVRSGNDAVLIAISSGIIGAVIGNAIAR